MRCQSPRIVATASIYLSLFHIQTSRLQSDRKDKTRRSTIAISANGAYVHSCMPNCWVSLYRQPKNRLINQSVRSSNKISLQATIEKTRDNIVMDKQQKNAVFL